MCLSYQVYAPIFGQDRCFHRTLFLFCCKSPECYKCNDSRCMKGNFGFWNFSSLFVLLCNSIPDSKWSLKPESSVSVFPPFAFLPYLDKIPSCINASFSSSCFSFQKSASKEEWLLPIWPSTRSVCVYLNVSWKCNVLFCVSVDFLFT